MSWSDTIKRGDALIRRLELLPKLGPAAIAAWAAQRLMDAYVPSTDNSDEELFIVGWNSALALLWKAMIEPSPAMDRNVRARLANYYEGPHSYRLGGEPGEYSDNNTAAAAIYALEAYCDHGSKSASYAVQRLLDASQRAKQNPERDLGPVTEEERRNWALAMDKELGLLEASLQIIEEAGVTPSSVRKMQKALQLRARIA